MRVIGSDNQPVVLDRQIGANGELLLRRAAEHFEIISNGVFLMDTRNGESERLLVARALDLAGPSPHVLIGGLGMGFSLMEALRRPDSRRVTVVEKEPAVIRWHSSHLRDFSQGVTDDPRVTVECADVLEWLRDSTESYDAICLDTDNGPEWTVSESNVPLYAEEGLELVAARLAAGGVAAFWSSHASPAFWERLRGRFDETWTIDVPVTRGAPDVVYFARGRR